MEAHLLACRECREDAAKLMKDDALLKALRDTESAALEKAQATSQSRDDPLIQRIVERLQGLPTYSSNPDGSRDLTDQELEWLSAAGTVIPPDWPVTKK